MEELEADGSKVERRKNAAIYQGIKWRTLLREEVSY